MTTDDPALAELRAQARALSRETRVRMRDIEDAIVAAAQRFAEEIRRERDGAGEAAMTETPTKRGKWVSAATMCEVRRTPADLSTVRQVRCSCGATLVPYQLEGGLWNVPVHPQGGDEDLRQTVEDRANRAVDEAFVLGKQTAGKYHTALEKIDDIRNSIIGTQTVNWSMHIYPLVAALEEAGFKGDGYEKAHSEAQTLIEERDALKVEVERLRARATDPTEDETRNMLARYMRKAEQNDRLRAALAWAHETLALLWPYLREHHGDWYLKTEKREHANRIDAVLADHDGRAAHAEWQAMEAVLGVVRHLKEWDDGGRVDTSEMDLVLNVLGHRLAALDALRAGAKGGT